MSSTVFVFQSIRRSRLVAGFALVALFPSPYSTAAAQSDSQRASRSFQPTGHAPAGVRLRRDTVDFFDFRDAILHSTSGSAATTADALPLHNDVVCIAGCDRAAGSVVYSGRTKTNLDQAAASNSPYLKRVSAEQKIETAQTSPVTCIAGCYEPAARRTVASLSAASMAKASAGNSRQQGTTVAVMPAQSSAVKVPADTRVADARSIDAPPTNLRAAVITPTEVARARQTTAKRRKATAQPKPARTSTAVAQNTTKNNKIAAATKHAHETSAPHPQATPSAVAETAVQQSNSHLTEPPVTKFAIRRASKQSNDRPKPHASASSDWFNRIKREQEEKATSDKQKPSGVN